MVDDLVLSQSWEDYILTVQCEFQVEIKRLLISLFNPSSLDKSFSYVRVSELQYKFLVFSNDTLFDNILFD